MSYYDHATMIAHRLGPWQQNPEPPFDVPAEHRKLRRDRFARCDPRALIDESEIGDQQEKAAQPPRKTGWRFLVCRIAALASLVQTKGLTGPRKA